MEFLLKPFTYKGLTFKNRIVMPPMCQYSAQDGVPNEWHLQHYVSRAVGGTGLIIVEMTNVEPDGRITNHCLGLWNDAQKAALARIVSECKSYGAKMGVQIAHAGRKAEDTDQPVSSVAKPFSSQMKTPKALTLREIEEMIGKFKRSAEKAIEAGVDIIELHGAHGYLIHQFHSPFINNRTDEYGKELTKFGVDIIKAVKSVMPADMPLIMRISGKEYVPNGYGIDYAVKLCKVYKDAGVDWFHVSSGGEASYEESGMTPRGIPSSEKGYQVPLANEIKNSLDVPVIAVGKLEDPEFADAVIASGKADFVAVGRGMLNNPHWALNIYQSVGDETAIPFQYRPGFYIPGEKRKR